MGRRRRRRQSWRRVRVRRARRASPPGAARALLPDGRFVRGGRGPRAGDLPASLARARTLRGRFVVPRLAVSHRDERLPRRAPAQIAKTTIAALLRKNSVTPTIPKSTPKQDRTERHRTKHHDRRQKDDRAHLPHHHPTPPTPPTNNTNPP